jgi:hypothetical protein
MTIREYVEKRKALVSRITLLLVCAMVGGSTGIAKMPLKYIGWFFVVYLAMVLSIAPLVAWRTKCPRCAGRLIQDFWPRKMQASAIPDCCPHCGVSLNETMKTPLTQA